MRLIDAEAIIEVMKKCAENPENAQALLCYRYAQRILEEAPTVEPASPWHRVEEPQKEHGPFLCAAKTKRNGQTHWFFELCWYADGDLRDVVWDAKQESGFYSWNASQDRYIDRTVDYWMPIAPPKEEP